MTSFPVARRWNVGVPQAGAVLWLSMAGALAQNTGSNDLRVLAVEAFMAARTLPHNVEARKLMTAELEEDYLRGKRLSIRVRSGRIVAFNFDPAAIKGLGDKEFEVEVESLWADLNEQVFATQYEKLKFVKLKQDWLANDIQFLRSVPGRRLLPFNVVSEKRGKLALAVAKKFMKNVINGDSKLAIQSLTQDFQSRFASQQELEKYLAGPADPAFAAYELHTLTQKDPREMEVKLKIYLVSKGKRGTESHDARLVVKEGKTDWNVDEFELIKS
jgi:hypothetical protein